MNEDAACGNPYGLEPLAVATILISLESQPEELCRHNLAYDEDLDQREYEDDYDR